MDPETPALDDAVVEAHGTVTYPGDTDPTYESED